ncbi:MAG: ABC transporter ATP-binding protein [Candidatus Adiutrix sp.]|jgi:branched-chain amino acid transport system ATP-binding protein|nr:ABC transporter ATP-binding protein [Candidatus Adiutrix sp.]
MTGPPPIIETRGLSKTFGGLVALDEVDFQVERGSITALIGPNGAGKTTLFNCLTGIYQPTRGHILLRLPRNSETEPPIQTALNDLRPDQVTALGLARTFQNIRLFNNLTVLENVLIGCHPRMKAGLWGALMRTRQARIEERAMAEFSMRLLEKYGLGAAANDLAKNLPYGDQRRLEIIRALATGPRLLLLDEPAAGLNIAETNALDDLIRLIREREGLSILLIEHDMNLVMSVSEKVWVMEYGRLIATGRPEEIKNDPVVIRAYLGEE